VSVPTTCAVHRGRLRDVGDVFVLGDDPVEPAHFSFSAWIVSCADYFVILDSDEMSSSLRPRGGRKADQLRD
jgi:hypothetical protein